VNKALLQQLMQLTPAERIELAMDLWDSVGPEDMPPLTAEQIEECERRLAEHEKDPSTAIPWEDVRAYLWSRLK
jgi:putative addiction module component (TIGR02574 family)